jgi:hypothetical protein
MIKTITSNSDLAITGDNLFGAVEFVFKGRKKSNLLAIVADESNDNIKVYFRDKEKGGYPNTAGVKTPEVITLQTSPGLADSAAVELIDAINGLPKNSGSIKAANGTESLMYGVDGVEIPTFTITNTDVAITGTAADDFTFTLASATIGCTFSAVLTMDDDSHTFTKTGTIATATYAINFDSTSFSAGAATLVVTLTNPNQPDSTREVSKAATITA